MNTKSYAAHSATQPLEPYTFEQRPLGTNELAIEIMYCGICHSDIHTVRSEWGPARYPCIPGHEITGKVTEVGSGVSNFKVGDQVGVGCMVNSCGTCPPCHEGTEQFCDSGFTATYNSSLPDGDYTKGGYANKIHVSEKFALNIPDGLDMAAAAPLLCAGITTYSPLRRLGINKNSKVAINGLGGLGHMGVKMAASFGAEVTVFSRSISKKEDAERLGAHHFILSTNPDQMMACTGKFDVVLDTVSAMHDITPLLNSIKVDGTLAVVGLPNQPVPLNLFSIVGRRRSIMGSLIGGIGETQEMLNHCAKHNITSDIELIDPSQINEAYERVLRSDIKYRFVIDCGKF